MKQAGVIQEKQTFALLVPSDAQRVQPYWSRWSHSDTENLWTLQWVCQCSNIWKGEVTCVLVSHVQEGQKPGFNWVNTDTSNPTVWWVCLVLCQLGSTIVRHLRHSSLLYLNKCVIMCSLVFMFFAQQCFPTEINPSQQIKSSNQAGSTLIVTIYHWLYIKMDHVIDLRDTKNISITSWWLAAVQNVNPASSMLGCGQGQTKNSNKCPNTYFPKLVSSF